jgi:hypothetical protein
MASLYRILVWEGIQSQRKTRQTCATDTRAIAPAVRGSLPLTTFPSGSNPRDTPWSVSGACMDTLGIQLPSWAPKFHEVDNHDEAHHQHPQPDPPCGVSGNAKGDRHERRGDRQDKRDDDEAGIERQPADHAHTVSLTLIYRATPCES